MTRFHLGIRAYRPKKPAAPATDRPKPTPEEIAFAEALLAKGNNSGKITEDHLREAKLNVSGMRGVSRPAPKSKRVRRAKPDGVE